jgi:septation ring formation regulator EzrA
MKLAGVAAVSATVLAGAYQGVAVTHDTIQQLDQLQDTVQNTHAYAELVGERLENKIAEDQYHAVEQRQWSLDERYKGIEKAPGTAREEYRRLEQDKEGLKRRLAEINERVRALSSRESLRK